MKIKVSYYAVLRERSGLGEETLETSASTITQLYAELDKKYRFGLSTCLLRAAINNAFVAWETPLKEGDQIVFIPPVAGG